MPQLARYLQINTARDATPTKYDYALVLNGEDIETKPAYGEAQPKKNVTLFGTHNEKDFGSVGCVNRAPFRPKHPAPRRYSVHHARRVPVFPRRPSQPTPPGRAPAPGTSRQFTR